MSRNKEDRLVSLDALRASDMFFIMGGDALLASPALLFSRTVLEGLDRQMRHASGNGFTALDIVFPLFLFIAGVAFPFSLVRQKGQVVHCAEYG